MTSSLRGVRVLFVSALTAALLVAAAGSSWAAPVPAHRCAAASCAPPHVRVVGTLARDLRVPWGIAFLPNGDALVSGRDAGTIVRVGRHGGTKRVGRVPGVVSNGASGGEGGLLGLAVRNNFSTSPVLYAYVSTRSDNRVVRMRYSGGKLGRPHAVITGIPRGLHHNGGRIAFGPDGMLYVTTGESGVPALAQRRSSLGGKILRATPSGGVPADNPFRGSLVYSLGHRNVEGLAWDSAGRLWATEFGEHTWDELNLVRPGGNYGWPATEGPTSNARYVAPKVVWRTDNAGPSGIAIIRDVAWIGGLTGHRLWRVPLNGTHVGAKRAFLTGGFGRLRTAQRAPDGSLWLTTSNTDGRATPGRRDDRILRLSVG
jgi:glucose/arabinose dehydrogenase